MWEARTWHRYTKGESTVCSSSDYLDHLPLLPAWAGRANHPGCLQAVCSLSACPLSELADGYRLHKSFFLWCSKIPWHFVSLGALYHDLD